MMPKFPAKKKVGPLSNVSVALCSFCLSTKSIFSHFYVYFVSFHPVTTVCRTWSSFTLHEIRKIRLPIPAV